MNSLAPHRQERETRMSQVEDEQKLAEGRMQLQDEAESRARRVKMRKQRQAKLAAIRKAKRRNRAFKLAGVWALLIIGGFLAVTWFSNDMMALVSA